MSNETLHELSSATGATASANVVPFPSERREPLERGRKVEGGGTLLILPVIKVERPSSDE